MAPLLDYIVYMTYDLHGQVWPPLFSMRRMTTSTNVEFFFLLYSGILAISGHSLAARRAPVCVRT